MNIATHNGVFDKLVIKYNMYKKICVENYFTTKVRKHKVLATARGSRAATRSQTLIFLQNIIINMNSYIQYIFTSL